MDSSSNKFSQKYSPDGGFLQSEQWRKFQEAVGRRTFCVSGEGFYASIIEHKLPVVGSYFYIPRGPIISCGMKHETCDTEFQKMINLAKENNAGWIRIEPADKETLNIFKAKPFPVQGLALKIQKAPHDMQPREILMIDITKPEEELLAEMKSKTRYNIKVAQKHGVSLRITNSYETTNKKDIEEFLRLIKITAKRDGITPHPENYYRQMFETIPAENLKLYIAEYNGKIIAANIVIFYPHTKTAAKESLDKKNISDKNSNFGVGACGNTATYLHGASDNEFRNVMAPYLLQWQAILDAKKVGIEKYDLGGVSTNYEFYETTKKWQGITKFKTGFSPETKPIEFPGSYDIVINPVKYNLYRIIQKIKSLV